MATIRARKQSDGTTRYTAIVRVPLQASIYSTRRLNRADSEMPWLAATADNRLFTATLTHVDK